MAAIEDLLSDSDTSDDDYMPGLEGEVLSEEDESGDDEESGFSNEGSAVKSNSTKSKKKKSTITTSRKRKGGIKLENDEQEHEEDGSAAEAERHKELETEIQEEKKAKQAFDDQKKSDDIWASFLSDVGPRPGAKSSSAGSSSSTDVKEKQPSKTNASQSASKLKTSSETVKITKEFDFAGETVKITKEVAADSKEAKKQEQSKEPEEVNPVTEAAGIKAGAKRPSGGLGSLLGKISKKPKISTLDKSKLDWQSFKQDEGIDEELQIHNRGKSGFIERQAFLQRTDQRQFELERDVRLGLSGKR